MKAKGKEERGEGERRRVACGGVSVPRAAGADGVTPSPSKTQTVKASAQGAGLGNTVQQQTEWKEEAKVISSQSNARKEETQALKASAVLLRGLPQTGKRPTAFSVFAERTLLPG